MKSIKKILFGALLVAPMLIPTQTRANGIFDWLDKWLDKIEHNKKSPVGNPPSTTPTQGNAVPIDGGLVVLFAAGLGLGAKVLLDKRKQVETAVI